MLMRTIPSSGEAIPAVGLGTWQTFDVNAGDYPRLEGVLRPFAAAGGKVIDTSPMYGKAEEAVGALSAHVPAAFLATKVWTRGRAEGIRQMERSLRLLRTERIDLMQVHNLVDAAVHLQTLRQWKDEGRIRYLGVTHYHSGAFAELAAIMRRETLDFVQLPLSLMERGAERELLPIAQDRGIAVLVNRPFAEGALFRRMRGTPPAELGETWGEVALRWIVSHPAVTCVIPATGDPAHLADNLRAGDGRLYSAAERAAVLKAIS